MEDPSTRMMMRRNGVVKERKRKEFVTTTRRAKGHRDHQWSITVLCEHGNRGEG
jgi:hypothetical protein